MAFKFSIVLEAIDRMTRPMLAGATSIDKLGDATQKSIPKVASASRHLEELTRTRAGPAARETAHDIDRLAHSADRADRPLARLRDRLSAIGRVRIGGVLRGAAGALAPLARTGAGAVGAAAGFAGVAGLGAMLALPKAALEAGAQYEGYLNLLTVMNKGSGDQARRDLAWVTRFSAETPNELNEVMTAFITLRSQGLEPMDGTLRSLGDAAAVFAPMGKSLQDVTDALADAAQGEFERLKEFGIRAESHGNRVTLIYGNMRIETEKNSVAITAAVRRIFDTNFTGAMRRQAETLPGILSNISDHWNSFKVMIADAGLADFAKTELKTLLDWLNKAAASGQLQRWAKEISDSLVKMLGALRDIGKAVDWVGLIKNVADLASAIAMLVKVTDGFAGLRMAIDPIGTLRGQWDRFARAKAEADAARANRNGAVNAPGRLPAPPAARRAAPAAPAPGRPVNPATYAPAPPRGPPQRIEIAVRPAPGWDAEFLRDRGGDNDLEWRAFLGGGA